MARLVIVTGQKGGVGKTVTALALGTWLEQRGCAWSGIDSDAANQTFVDLGNNQVRGASLYDEAGFLDPTALNAIVDDLAERASTPETVILDVGAGQLPALIEGMRTRRLLGSELVLPTTIAYVLVADYASVSTLSRVVGIADGLAGVSWLVVRNERDGPITQYDGSQTRANLATRGAVELVIPALRDNSVFEALRKSHLTPSQFVDPANKQTWSARGQLITWLDLTGRAFAAHSAFLVGSEPPQETTTPVRRSVAQDVAPPMRRSAHRAKRQPRQD